MKYIFLIALGYFIFFVYWILSIRHITPMGLVVFVIYTLATIWCVLEIRRANKEADDL